MIVFLNLRLNMKSAISEYLPLKNSEKDNLWNDCLFVFDANVLLNLYRFSNSTSEVLFDAFKVLSSQIWIPHQVAYEFMNRRCQIVYETIEKYSSFESRIKDFLKDAKDLANLKDTDQEITQLSKTLFDWLGETRRNNIRVYDVNDDTVLEKILDTFDGKTGEKYSSERELAIRKKGEERFAAHIPPGYKDNAKKKSDTCDNNAYGDFFLWSQILDHAKERKKNVIFITNDQKEDWWYEVKGRTIGPRVELVQEFRATVGKQFHMYVMDNFITYFSRKYNKKLEAETIEEFKQISNLPLHSVNGREALLLQINNQINILEEKVYRSKRSIKDLTSKYGNRVANMPDNIAEQVTNTQLNIISYSKRIDDLKQQYFNIETSMFPRSTT